jgi:hypothetical protein
VIEHFKAQGTRYQSRINAVLRSYVIAQIKAQYEAKGKREAMRPQEQE